MDQNRLDGMKKLKGLNNASITSQEAAHALDGFHPPLSQLRHFSFPTIIILQGTPFLQFRIFDEDQAGRESSSPACDPAEGSRSRRAYRCMTNGSPAMQTRKSGNRRRRNRDF
jgi:hypothetical protein